MNSEEMINFCIKQGVLVDKEILNIFHDLDNPNLFKEIIEKTKEITQQRIITKQTFLNLKLVERILNSTDSKNEEFYHKIKIKLGLEVEIETEKTKKMNNLEILPEVKILSSPPSKSKKIELKDFVGYYRTRFNKLRNLLQDHSELDNLISINKISVYKQGISIIGLVYSKESTKNGNIILEVEDLTGKIKVLINSNKKDLFEKAEEIALDSVIGIKASGSKDILFCNDLVFPESLLINRKKSPFDESIVFLGDLHIGSKLFLENEFLKFIEYINSDDIEAKKIKYIFLVGDLVSGVGIYPGQEKDLSITDIEEQYNKSAELLSKIRNDIKIILSPGNHDSVRIMEPQPLLDEKYSWQIYQLPNVILTPNPSLVNIGSRGSFEGFNVLTYHGMSFHYYSNSIARLIKEKATHSPDKIMHFLLKNRHLAPSHGSTLYFPSQEDDPLIINNIPDIFLSGHTHKSAVSYYNNILTVSCSSWESKTPFQEKMGNEPDFCKVPVFNLMSRTIKILDFEDYAKENWKVR